MGNSYELSLVLEEKLNKMEKKIMVCLCSN